MKLHLTNGEILRVEESQLVWGQYSELYVETHNQVGFNNHMTHNQNINLFEVMSKHAGDYNYILVGSKTIPVKSICYVDSSR
ncbi:MAG: hypothetical protein DRI65_11395 [Chloroflexota bacterium]|nr:MAG: hypothetical protein DRI65_11395 [Chloroflexota bacterium]